MPFRTEPPHTHGSVPKTAVVLVNLGTPDAATRPAVRRYLKQFLSDPRVVEIPRAIWFLILHLVILPFRSGQSADKYCTIWTREGSPLRVHTARQARALHAALAAGGHQDVEVAMAMRYGAPALAEVLDGLKARGCERILVLPAYPQYSGTTTASIWDAVFSHYRHVRNIPELRLVKHYHDHPAYIEALAGSVERYWAGHGRGERLVLSFHGVPKRTLLRGDPYHCECQKTGRLLAARLGLGPDQVVLSFQSRFGRAEWLQPYTAQTVQQLARDGVRRIDVLCPGFTSDCLETLEEINMEVRHDFLANGGQDYHYIPCLNDNPDWIAAMADIAGQHMLGWPTRLDPAQLAARQADTEAGRAHAARLGVRGAAPDRMPDSERPPGMAT